MATLDTTTQLTLMELAKRKDPKGNLAVIAEVLTRTNDILLDAPILEANDTFSHQVTRRLSLPSGSWRRLNDGVTRHASQTTQVVETMGMLEDYAVVDKALYQNAPNPEAFRQSEVNAFLEGMSQTLARYVIYGNAGTEPEAFTGLAPRLNSLSADNVIDAGGTGANLTSIYIVQWGETKAHLIHPKSHKGLGIEHRDLGEQIWDGATSGTKFQAMVDHFKIHIGMAVRDPRCIARVANIDVSTLATAATFVNHIIVALNQMPQRGAGARLYCNSDVFTHLDIYAKDKTNVQYSFTDVFGRPVMTFRGLPVRQVDAILSTESQVS